MSRRDYLRKFRSDSAHDRWRADQGPSGGRFPLVPRPQSLDFSHTDVRRALEPPLPLPSDSVHTTPNRLHARGNPRQTGPPHYTLSRSLSVVAIDDSDDEDEENHQALFDQQFRLDEEHQDLPPDQQHQKVQRNQEILRGQQDRGIQKEPFAERLGQTDENEDLQQGQEVGEEHVALDDALQVQELGETREQTRILLELPEVNIPRRERFKTPRALLCELLPHQRVGLTWLIRQEEDPNKKGSILADGMGLGKTVEALALIVSRRFDPMKPNRKTTLIMAPLGLLQQWNDEIRNKVTLRYGNKLSTIIFHGQDTKKLTVQQLLQYDIILCTYGKIVSEYNMYTKGLYHQCKLLSKEAKFYRVILDEAHFIKNKNTRTSKAVCQLQAVHRLCMTGTPLMNTVTEFYPLIRFLGIKPYNDWNKFSEDVDCPIRKWVPGTDSPAMLKLQTLVRSLMLRRHKDSHLDNKRIINLKKRSDVDVYVKFGDEQQAFYNALQLQQKLKFNKYLKAGTVMKNYIMILTWILRMRQACDHPYLIQNHCIPDACSLDAEGMIELALQLPSHVVRAINAIRQFRCPKCRGRSDNITENPVIISPCGHYICAECYAELMENQGSILPAAEEFHTSDKFNCPGETCDSMITPDNILMHNFFVDAHNLGNEDKLGLSDDNEESSGNEELSDNEENDEELVEFDDQEQAEFDCEGDEDGDFDHGSHRGYLAPSVNEQREASCGLFVDPYPSEPDPLSSNSSSDEEYVSGDEQASMVNTVKDSNALRESTTPQVTKSTLLPISRRRPGGHVVSGQAATTPTPARQTAQSFRVPKGHYGNPVNLDDEEEEAAFNAVSRCMAAEARASRAESFENEIKDEHPQFSDVPNYDGPGSPGPRSKRKATISQRASSGLKKARHDRGQSSLNGVHRRKSNFHVSLDSGDESPCPSHRVNPKHRSNGQRSRAVSCSPSQEGLSPYSCRDPQDTFPKMEEEDSKPDIHQMSHKIHDVLQKPFVSLSAKRQIADKSQRAMVAYQKRVANEWVGSAKTEKLMDLLQYIRRTHPGEKTLVFSLWTVFLDMLEPPLRESKFRYTFYTGGMKTDNRTAAVKTFMSDPDLDVMLVSLSAGSYGLNLTAANHVILTEPFWNPFTEEQAIDRAHRLGQEKEVTVYRLLVKDTIEDHIVRLQRRKKTLVSTALCDAEIDSPVNKLTIGELKELFGV